MGGSGALEDGGGTGPGVLSQPTITEGNRFHGQALSLIALSAADS